MGDVVSERKVLVLFQQYRDRSVWSLDDNVVQKRMVRC